jgi:hypothetical protein
MKLSVRSSILYTATFAGLLMLSACGKNDAPAPTAAPTTPAPASTAPAVPAVATTTAAAPVAAPAPVPAAAAPAAVVDSLKVDSVVLGNAVGNDKKVSKAKASFLPTDKTIYASVSTVGNSAGATLNTKWIFEDGQTVSDITLPVSTDGPTVTTFTVHNPNEWPEGKYKVAVTLNGQSVANEAFEVKKR